MRNTGFSEITEERAMYHGDDPWFIEIAITGKCNFSCSYCNRFFCVCDKEAIEKYFSTFNRCRHIQITGGEPTLHADFIGIMRLCKAKSDKVGLSTNGSADIDLYKQCGADMFSISIDDYDLDILSGRGYKNPSKIISNIKELSKNTYVNIGLVIDSKNKDRIEDIIDFILKLGVDDIKLSTSTKDEAIPVFTKSYPAYPILNYRVENFKNGHQMRGWPGKKCKIAENDVTIVGNHHYPCLVYFREGGKAIGAIIDDARKQRNAWVILHNPKDDTICKKYCMDFKCEFNGGTY